MEKTNGEALGINYDNLPYTKSKIFDASWNNVLAALILLLLYICLVIMVDVGSFTQRAYFLFITFIPITLLTCFGFYQSYKRNKSINNGLRQFSIDNSFELQKPSTIDPILLNGSLFMNFTDQLITHSVHGSIDGYAFTFFNLKHSRNKNIAVMQVELKRYLPHMVIDSLVETGNDGLSTLPINFDESQKIELEGDFNKYFNLYAPDNYSTSALTVLAPDVMITLLESTYLCDVEIIKDKLYLYWPKSLVSKERYETYFETTSHLLNKIGRKLNDSNIFTSENELQANSLVNSNGISLKYKKRYSPRDIFITLLPVFVILSSFTDITSRNMIIGILIAFMFMLVTYFGIKIRKEQLEKSVKYSYSRNKD